jgi:hypothetical protein
VTPNCDFSQPENPKITVTVQRTGLPTFFARIWGAGANSLSSTAKAEAYNPSGSTFPIEVKSVKPWLIPNCDPTTTPTPAPPPSCLGNPYFVDPSANYALKNPTNYIGKFFLFTQTKTPPIAGGYYAIDLSQATVCPSSSAQPAGSCSQLGSNPPYHDNIACANTATLTCGSSVNVLANTATPAIKASTVEGTQCLMRVDSGQRCPT